MKKINVLLILFFPFVILSQNSSIEGQITDTENNPISFVNILLSEEEGALVIAGATTNEEGFFIVEDLEEKEYYLT